MNFASPQTVNSVEDCFFYHTIDLPQKGRIEGLCDMRSTIEHTIDPIDWEGTRVLEIGPANGFYTFEMERQGADVVACELSPEDEWDIVPHPTADIHSVTSDFRDQIEKIQRGFWFSHGANQSKARVLRSSVYDIPEDIGSFEVATIHHVLLHLRDPCGAVMNVAQKTTKTLVISEIEPYGESRMKSPLRWLARKLKMMEFLPRIANEPNRHTWWHLSPPMVEEFCKLSGFVNTEIHYHTVNLWDNASVPGYTIIAHRD